MTDPIDLYDHSLYINRELSWLEFNRRCLLEAEDKTNPTLERVKFLAIAYGNMDEFFMIRIPGMISREIMDSLTYVGPDSYENHDEFVKDVNKKVESLVEGYDSCWNDLSVDLSEKNIRIRTIESLNKIQRSWIDDYYKKRVHALLTPLALDVSHPFPFISNNSLNLAVKIKKNENEYLYARVKVPTSILPRFVKIPSDKTGVDFVLLENILKANIGLLFPGSDIVGIYNFRVTRNADVKVTIDEACDLMSAVETSLDSRDMGFPVRMMVEEDMPQEMIDLFGRNLKLSNYQIHKVSVGGMLLTDLWEVAGLNYPKLKEKPFLPFCPPEFGEDACIFNTIRERDWILFHPYESFDAVIHLLNEAADDPKVQSIKICLYRIGKDPSMIRALMRAKEKGKAVSVLMELRAKFDETNNIHLAKELEKMGVHVVYGPVELKVHSKLLQIIRLEGEHLIRYTHLSSGNYNSSTAKQYGDISFFTANQVIGQDVGELFNALTGFFGPRDYSHLLVAPLTLKSELLRKIRREADNQRAGNKGYVVLKANGLVDSDIIAELYRASQAGVKIELIIRGLCCLRPGIPGVSENIRVTSVVDMFLEHSRIYYFENGGDPEMYMGSSDMMPRNLIARVEVLFPVLDKEMMVNIRENILNVHLNDNVKAKVLNSSGEYLPVVRKSRAKKLRSQKWFIENRGVWHGKH
ncbi:MAG: polyphosphate kinase 1 [Candidatus Methanogranum gryphiswaldense]|nr:MAG: polyphosphate kinase 1 [Candidatus Methanogranum sp. U3.2.1]